MLRTTQLCHSSKTTVQNVGNNRFLSLIKHNSAECCEQQIPVTLKKQLCRMLRTTELSHSSKTTLQNVANNRFMSIFKNNSAECCEQQNYVTHQKLLCRTTNFCNSSKTALQNVWTTDFCHSSKTTLQNVANNIFLSLIKNNTAKCCE
jgi:hypothetical protein